MHNIENWEVAPESDGYGWQNTETGTNLGVIPNEDGDGWVVATDNHVLGRFTEKDEAREEAYEWMKDSPRPVNLG